MKLIKPTLPLLLAAFLFASFSCSSKNGNPTEPSSHTQPQPSMEKAKSSVQDKKLKKAYFASGCFWCVEAIYESVRGVKEVISGYSGGEKAYPTYEEIGTGTTGHAEAVEVHYDPSIVNYKTLVKVFYGSHDPTTVNGQHPDYGTQYRSMIYYQNDDEKKVAENHKAAIAKEYDKAIATEIVPLKKFWKAEDYHQDYERLHPDQPYVVNVSIPRLRQFQKKFPELLKEGKKHH